MSRQARSSAEASTRTIARSTRTGARCGPSSPDDEAPRRRRQHVLSSGGRGRGNARAAARRPPARARLRRPRADQARPRGRSARGSDRRGDGAPRRPRRRAERGRQMGGDAGVLRAAADARAALRCDRVHRLPRYRHRRRHRGQALGASRDRAGRNGGRARRPDRRRTFGPAGRERGDGDPEGAGARVLPPRESHPLHRPRSRGGCAARRRAARPRALPAARRRSRALSPTGGRRGRAAAPDARLAARPPRRAVRRAARRAARGGGAPDRAAVRDRRAARSRRGARRDGGPATLMLRNMAFASISAASAALLLILFVVAGRTLGDVEFGKFSFALALGTIFETLMDFGLHQVTIRAVARDRTQATALLHHTLAIKLIWGAAALAALAATATALRPEWDVRLACYLLGGSLVLRSYMLTIRGVLQGLERFGWDSIVVAADRAILLAFGAAALAAGAGLQGLALAFVLARGTALALAAWLTQAELGGVGFRYDRDIWRELHTTALPLGFFLVVLHLYSYVDGVMLGVMRGNVETGYYAAAYRTYEGMSYLPSIIAAVLTPRLADLFVRDRREHRRLALGGFGAAIGLAVLVGGLAYTLATPLLALLFGGEFRAAAEPFRILCIGLPLVFGIWILHAITMSVNRERLLAQTAVVGLAVNVGLNLYVIPRMGADGAALATVVGELVSMTVLIAGVGGEVRAARA